MPSQRFPWERISSLEDLKSCSVEILSERGRINSWRASVGGFVFGHFCAIGHPHLRPGIVSKIWLCFRASHTLSLRRTVSFLCPLPFPPPNNSDNQQTSPLTCVLCWCMCMCVYIYIHIHIYFKKTPSFVGCCDGCWNGVISTVYHYPWQFAAPSGRSQPIGHLSLIDVGYWIKTNKHLVSNCSLLSWTWEPLPDVLQSILLKRLPLWSRGEKSKIRNWELSETLANSACFSFPVVLS